MIVEDLSEILVVDVLERGVPNQECIVLMATEKINIGRHGIMLGIKQGELFAAPVRDHLFWFGDAMLNDGDWIFLYTGSGKPTNNLSQDAEHNIYSIYWGKTKTVFASSEVIPILFRIDAVDLASAPQDKLQR